MKEFRYTGLGVILATLLLFVFLVFNNLGCATTQPAQSVPVAAPASEYKCIPDTGLFLMGVDKSGEVVIIKGDIGCRCFTEMDENIFVSFTVMPDQCEEPSQEVSF